jgi:hypothetical protein
LFFDPSIPDLNGGFSGASNQFNGEAATQSPQAGQVRVGAKNGLLCGEKEDDAPFRLRTGLM